MGALREIKIIKVNGKHIIDGTQDWATPCPAELIAHDIFHHFDGDDGSMACELMSFGAQAWIEHHKDGIQMGIHCESLCAILEDIAEIPNNPKHASLIAPEPNAFAPIDYRFFNRFVELASEALTQSGMSREFADLSDDFVSEVCSEENMYRYVGWMSLGLIKAQERYYQPEATRIMFGATIKAIEAWSTGGAADGSSVTLIIDEESNQITSTDALVNVLLGEIMSKSEADPELIFRPADSESSNSIEPQRHRL